MRDGIHFISGLPRSGSTLLSALLWQNPRLHPSMTSPVGSLVNGLLRQMSQENEAAVFDSRRERLMLVRYESLTADPLGTLKAIYDFVGEAPFAQVPGHIEQDFDALEFDNRLGAQGLHSVGATVRVTPRPTILPPDLFHKYDGDAFWEREKEMPGNVRVV